ncbi:hypothetical protein RPPX_19635 [Pseudomonas putida S12]|uniref:Uncharacterized protein n=1 Tax=Pseudomonas putida S12 TaxID=1215087 RepID=A0AA34WSM6_PSEPU|nr:hypothetical protein RPPX_19635 [Pseudomonas putida S12]
MDANRGAKDARPWDTGRPLNQIAALASWVTPTTRDWKDTPGMTAQRDGTDRVDQLPRQAYLCGWPTPLATDGDKADATLPVVLKRIEQMGHMAAFMRAECSAEHICTPPGIDLSSH